MQKAQKFVSILNSKIQCLNLSHSLYEHVTRMHNDGRTDVTLEHL